MQMQKEKINKASELSIITKKNFPYRHASVSFKLI